MTDVVVKDSHVSLTSWQLEQIPSKWNIISS